MITIYRLNPPISPGLVAIPRAHLPQISRHLPIFGVAEPRHLGRRAAEPATGLFSWTLRMIIQWKMEIYPLVISHSYGKSPFFMCKSTISMVIFNSYFDITRGYIYCESVVNILLMMVNDDGLWWWFFWWLIRRPRLQQGERVRGGITSSKGQEVITSSKGKKQENKKEETRSKKQLQATSGKKQETRSQEATSGWKTGQRASFLVDSESNVRQAAAPFVMRLLAAGRQLRQLVFLSVQKATLGTGGRGPQARSVLQGPAVLLWRRRRLWALTAGRELVFL